MRSTESAIISSYPTTNVSGIIVLLNTKHWIKISRTIFFTESSFCHFVENFSVIKMLVSIFGQTTVYKIYTVSKEPIRLPETQYPVFWYLTNQVNQFLYMNIQFSIVILNGVLINIKYYKQLSQQATTPRLPALFEKCIEYRELV